jgi:tRNA G18 (ribose-2'-O)-methylase SpoU
MSFNVHDHYKDLSVEDLKLISNATRLPYAVCLLNLEYDLNIGNCIRTAHIFGAERVFIFGRRRYDLRSTVGANHYTNIVKYDFDELTNDEVICTQFENMVSEYSLYPLLIDKTINSRDISDSHVYTKPYAKTPCLVFGNENSGIPTCLTDKYLCFHIPQRGVIRSLNVASAAAVAMYEFSKYL